MKLYLKKLPNGTLAPDDADSIAALQKIKIGQVVSGEFKRKRNYEFHKKYFALIDFAYDQLEYDEQLVTKEDFRKQIQMAAGYRREVVSVFTGDVRWESVSISFDNMDQDTFDDLYDKVCTVLTTYVLKNYTRNDIDNVMGEIARFAA